MLGMWKEGVSWKLSGCTVENHKKSHIFELDMSWIWIIFVFLSWYSWYWLAVLVEETLWCCFYHLLELGFSHLVTEIEFLRLCFKIFKKTCWNLSLSPIHELSWKYFKYIHGLELLYKKKQLKLQWLQNSSQRNGDNLNNILCKSIRTSRNKKREYLKEEINELEISSKNKNIRNWYRGIMNLRTFLT
jgi:hypothetical protein